MGNLTEIERLHLECLRTFRIDTNDVIEEYRQSKHIFPWKISLSNFIEGCLVSVALQKSEPLNGKYLGLAYALKRPINHVANYGFGHLEPGERDVIWDKFRKFRTSREINDQTQLILPQDREFWKIIYSPTRYSICGLLQAVEI